MPLTTTDHANTARKLERPWYDRLPIALPGPHFMSFAPLDVWWRVFARARRWVGPRYWLRLAAMLTLSTVATVATLPERLFIWPLVRRVGRSGGRSGERHDPAKVLVVLGYYRSGTTHLHYLLSADPKTVAPTWTQCVLPQGFVGTWALLRWVLVPFLGTTRPQDGVAFGSQWPAEDDFYLANRSAASTLFGRFVFPRARDRFDAWNRVSAASARDQRAFKRTMREMVDKIGLLRPGRVIVLKTPAHTARIPALVDAFGEDNVRFVHVSREPGAVVKSNLAMHRRLRPYELEAPPSEDELRDQITEEFLSVERSFLADAHATDRVCRLRYQDLLADPEGSLERIHDELDLGEWGIEQWGPEADHDSMDAMRGYLATVRRYEPRHGGGAQESIDPRLAQLADEHGHGEPVVEPREPRAPREVPENRRGRGGLAAGVVAVLLIGVWIGLAWMTGDRLDWLSWPVGLVIGAAGLAFGRTGSPALGAWCGALVVVVIVSIAFPATYLAYVPDWAGDQPWFHVRKSIREGMLRGQSTWVYLFLGIASAYQYASRAHPSPPGGGRRRGGQSRPNRPARSAEVEAHDR